jgi:hypothetical protein
MTSIIVTNIILIATTFIAIVNTTTLFLFLLQ